MLSAFKLRLQILRINLKNSLQIETAYFWNNWASLLSTLFYTLTYILFINIIFANVTNMAGYSRDEMLFFTLIGQIIFYILAITSFINTDQLVTDVNRGNLDLILTKPLPSLFYVSTRRINLLEFIRDGGIPTLFVIFAINWSSLNLTTLSLFYGLLTLVMGILAADSVRFLLSYPVFWFGESGELSNLYYSLMGIDLPLEGMNKYMRLAFIIVIPVMLAVAFTTSIMLNKSQPYPLILIAFLVSLVFVFLKIFLWKKALRNYTSASS